MSKSSAIFAPLTPVKRYARLVGLDQAVSVHSLRVTARTTAREKGCDIIDLQEYAGHSDPPHHAHLYKE